ncbi:MAG: radical SAM protein [Methanogenium sp.]|jgi:radical SAM superfamily enzyme YgiQ (UPF0313 family)
MIVSKNKNGPVVLVSCDITYTFPLSYPYLASYLIAQGEDVRVFFKEGNLQNIVNQIMLLKPLVVGFGSLYPELKQNREMIEMLNKAGRDFPIIVGGQMVSPIPEFAIEITGADIGVIGEGEITLDRIVKALRRNNSIFDIKGLVIKEGNKFTNTGVGDYIEDLTKLPPVQYDLFPAEKWLPIGKYYRNTQWHWDEADRVINVHGGRGCPYNCNFCYHHSKPRYRPVNIMMEEASDALKRFDGNVLYFSDDTVLCSPNRAKQIVKGIENLDRKVGYSVSSRIDILSRMDDSTLIDMKNSGCRVIGIGIESGSDRILQTIGKNYTTEMVVSVIKRLARIGIFVTTSIMVGQLTETKADAKASLELLKTILKIDPQIQFACTYTCPYPGSPLYDYILAKHRIKSHRDFYDIFFHSGREYKVNFSAMSDQEVTEMVLLLEGTWREMFQKRV